MGLRNIVHRLPVVRYVESVREGSREQAQRAELKKQATQSLVTTLSELHRQNHFSELVAKTLGAK